MGISEYQDALKLGKKEYKLQKYAGKFPYLPVLDELVDHEEMKTEQYMGLQNIPLSHVVGTSTAGRTQAFASNYMPLLPEKSEFAAKWSALADVQVTEGIRDPIQCYEYMNRFYVVEGNKRVSVMKYYEAVSIPALVTRKIPKLTDDNEVQLYYEFMEFSEATGLNTIEFSQKGNAHQLLELVGRPEPWTDETQENFSRIVFYFSRAYKFQGGEKLNLKLGDAITCFMSIFGYTKLRNMSDNDYRTNIARAWNEFVVMAGKKKVDLVLNPKTEPLAEKRPLWSYFMPTSSPKLTVAFLYPKSPEESDWIYAHELGRTYLEETFPDDVTTIRRCNVKEPEVDNVIENVISQGADIVFGIAPQMMTKSLQAAIEHPEVKILNCSLNTPHPYIRTYYARMYEAKFISGMIAGAMTENERIGYIADYPIFGMTANINAFALGVSCVNPRARIYLDWSTKKGYDINRFIEENGIHYLSNQDMITPKSASRNFGLYHIEGGETINLAMPFWNWGIFYEKLIRSIMAGNYEQEGRNESKALNYWWGMSAGVIDLICSNNVPDGVKRLAQNIKRDICKGTIVPFSGEIHSQDDSLVNRENQDMPMEKIMKMDWLNENVIGTIPGVEEFIEEAHAIVELKGVEEVKEHESFNKRI